MRAEYIVYQQLALALMHDTTLIGALDYPFRSDIIHKKKKAIKTALLETGPFLNKRIAILGGSTSDEIKDVLELFLLREGIRPNFYQSEYNRYYEDVMFPNEKLESFKPEIVYIHTTQANISHYPAVVDSLEDVETKFQAELTKFTDLWGTIRSTYNCTIIQNNFELPPYRVLGNLDFARRQGKTNFIMRLNLALAAYAQTHQDFYVNDINYLAASFGLGMWHDLKFWYAYKYALSYDAIPLLGNSISRIVTAVCGKSKKGLVLDLDNTLWGGVIGDDGADNIKIGKGTAIAEAYSAFQRYVAELKDRGIVLAVCSKNDPIIAAQGFAHPDSVLAYRDFAAFSANWDPKHFGIRQIAYDINIGLDSLVFIDDNPAERDIIRTEVPEVEVPEVGSNIVDYISFVDRAGYFEPVVLSADDMQRARFYEANLERKSIEAAVTDYREFLATLKMVAEIRPFSPAYVERISQLINKTNQFNVTTKRCSLSDVEAMSQDTNCVTLYGRLADKFGDNGLISVVAGTIRESILHIDIWLMSCRVIKREMEFVMFDELVTVCRARGITRIVGYYFPTAKNAMVADLFAELGFVLTKRCDHGDTEWAFDVLPNYQPALRVITVART